MTKNYGIFRKITLSSLSDPGGRHTGTAFKILELLRERKILEVLHESGREVIKEINGAIFYRG